MSVPVLRRRAAPAPDPAARSRRPGRGQRFVRWIEDHAKPLVITTWSAFAACLGILLLWKTTSTLHVVHEAAPFLEVALVVTAASGGALRFLTGRRDRRLQAGRAAREQIENHPETRIPDTGPADDHDHGLPA